MDTAARRFCRRPVLTHMNCSCGRAACGRRALTHTDGSLHPPETNKTAEAGAPREQGHYAFMLTDLSLLPLLSGQSVDLLHGRLSLAPMYPPPYVLPVLVAGMEGSLTSLERGSYELKVRGMLGDEPEDDKEITILGRRLRWTDGG